MPSISFTLTATNKNYRLIDIITGTDTTSVTTAAGATYVNAYPNCRQLNIQSDPANGGAKVFYGDSKLTATNYGAVLLNGDDKDLQSDVPDIALTNKYIRTDTNPVQVNVSWEN